MTDICCKYNGKLKVYPDNTIVAVFSNLPKFKLPASSENTNRRTDNSFLNWNYQTDLKTNISYDNGYIHVDDWSGEIIYISPFLPANKQCLTDGNKVISKRADNVKRAKDKIFDLVALNDWDYIFTGTLGDTFYDPTNAKAALKPLQIWLMNMVSRKGLKYVLVAELQPKSGRIHFHGFINDALKMVDSGTRIVSWASKPVKIDTIRRKGYDPAEYEDRIVYNCPQWKFGFTTAIKAHNGSQACARYITKYITKDNKAVFGRYY